jgi:hypothetical protein
MQRTLLKAGRLPRTCRFSLEFSANLRIVTTNGKKEIKLSKENSACTGCLQKSSINLKGFDLKQLLTYWINLVLKRVNKNEFLVNLLFNLPYQTTSHFSLIYFHVPVT